MLTLTCSLPVPSCTSCAFAPKLKQSLISFAPSEQITPARKETCHTWDKLWTLNRRILEPLAPRHMAVAPGGAAVLLRVTGPGVPSDTPVVQEMGLKAGHVARVIWWKEVWLDGEDVEVRGAGRVLGGWS